MFDYFGIVVTKDDVLSGDISKTLSCLNHFIKSPEVARSYMEKVDIAFYGYNNDPRELYEIPEVRNYVNKLDEQFPYWLYFFSKKYLGLQAILLCLLPTYWKEQSKRAIVIKKIEEVLFNRWFVALNEIDDFIGRDDEVNQAITERTIEYVLNGSLIN
ncbi:MAG: chlororespiratory reduction 6 domain-containing protein [Desulfamplus sp.]|nr:chlororespiratory reduction 6 domain-containing protein [Desulfamplus sp.]